MGVLVHLAGAWLLAVVLRIPVVCVSFGVGPPLAERAVRGVALRLGALPIGGFVEPEELPSPGRAAAWMLGAPWLLLLAAVALAQGGAVAALLDAIPQLVRGALSPLDHGRALVEAMLAAAATLPLPELAGRVWATLVAFNVVVALQQVAVRALPDRVRLGASLVWALVMLALLGSWVVAFVGAIGS